MILVTGGAGFIGSHVCENLLKEGEEVVCVDNFNNYYNPIIKEDNIKDCIKDDKFILYREDIRDLAALKKIFKKNNIDKVVHLAARAGVRASIMDPSLYHEVNVNGTLNLLDLAKEFGVKNFIFGSSSSIYGVNKKVPFSEEDDVNNQISPYAVSKLIGEMLCKLYHEEKGMNITCLRFFTAYGPRNRPDMALYKFVKSIYQEKELTLFGDGTSERDYTYVGDVAQAIVSALNKERGFEVINIGNSKTIKLKEFIMEIEKIVGKKAKINFSESQEGDVPITYADISKAKRLLGYNPNSNIGEGIEKFFKYYTTNVNLFDLS